MERDDRRSGAAPVVALVLVAAIGLAGWRVAAPAQAPDAAGEPIVFGDPYAVLTELGYEVTGGAAPGYVDDGACAACHADLAASYAEVGMARSFYRPRAASAVEDFASGFFHQPSQRHYRMLRDGERYVFRRWQLDADGEEINVLEQPVDWVIGSGNHSRLYAYRTAAGELFQLPLAWYSQEGGHWGMAPGFELGNHQGLSRQVRRECMFCHNAYPDVPAGSDDYRQPHVFPERLPQGIGCQRCHGPGARHAALAFAEAPEPAAVRAAIVNPGRLEPALRDSVCESCHLQPASIVFRARRFDRADYSFRPGERLEDFLVPVDVVLADHPPEERFEVNHHPYRLRQSACVSESPAGAISCLSCHDPHRKVPVAERPAHYRAVCLDCHDAAKLATVPTGEPEATHAAVERLDCVACHMPERRTDDVIEVTMTDHRIGVVPAAADPTARFERDHAPRIVEAGFLLPQRSPQGAEGVLYLTATVARSPGPVAAAAVGRLEQLLLGGGAGAAARPAAPWIDLAAGLARSGRFERLPPVLDALEARQPGDAQVARWRGSAHFAAGDVAAAIAATRSAIERDPGRPEGHYNLGLYLLRAERHEEAVASFDEALRLRPNLHLAWFHRGRALVRLDRGGEAVADLRRALEVEPGFTRGYLVLADLLVERGESAEARRYLLHAERVGDDPEAARAALAALPAGE